jgi:hypothetical protein
VGEKCTLALYYSLAHGGTCHMYQDGADTVQACEDGSFTVYGQPNAGFDRYPGQGECRCCNRGGANVDLVDSFVPVLKQRTFPARIGWSALQDSAKSFEGLTERDAFLADAIFTDARLMRAGALLDHRDGAPNLA